MKTEVRLMLEKMEQAFDIPILDWTNEHMDRFILNLDITSANTAQTYIHIVRQAHKYVCLEAGSKYFELQPKRSMIDYINYSKLRSVTLNKREFEMIREELIYLDLSLGITGNYRDVAVFELAWYGLSATEIKHLKKEDIEEVKVGVSVHLPKRTVIIDDGEIAKDILKAKNEIKYYKIREYANYVQVQEVFLLESNYLIRPIDNGNATSGQPVTHIGMLLHKQLKKLVIPNIPIDFEHLSIEDIRRSRLIYMLNNTETDINDLQAFLVKKKKNDLEWLKPVAKKLKQMM